MLTNDIISDNILIREVPVSLICVLTDNDAGIFIRKRRKVMQKSRWYELNNSTLNLLGAVAPITGLDTMRGFIGTLGHADIRLNNSIGGIRMRK